jgi:CheY-like chemotaxis protein
MKKIVVVDDEPEVRSAINVMLSDQYEIKELVTVNEVIKY